MDKTELHKKFEQIYSQKLEPKIIPLEQERIFQRIKYLGLDCLSFIFNFYRGIFIIQKS